MAAGGVQITAVLPAAYGPELIVRFFPDYSAQHPLWFDFGHPDLVDLQLPEPLAGRLRRWSTYWDDTFHWDRGWPKGTPATWWAKEKEQLPRDVAIALGADFVIKADDVYLHSTTVATSPAAWAALHALIDAEAQDRARIRADFAAGARYDLTVGGTSYTQWLAARDQDEPTAE